MHFQHLLSLFLFTGFVKITTPIVEREADMHF